MAIVSKVTKQLEIPHEPGQWMELRRLSWRQLEAASDAQSNALMARVKGMSGDMIKALKEVAGQQEQKTSAKYDRRAVLQCGIVRWSYEEPVTPDNIDALDEETAAWAMQEILALNAPRSEEERKNGSSPSTSR